MNRTREELISDIMSMNAEQFAKLQVTTRFIFSLPKHQQAKAVELFTNGMTIPEIVKRLAVAA